VTATTTRRRSTPACPCSGGLTDSEEVKEPHAGGGPCGHVRDGFGENSWRAEANWLFAFQRCEGLVGGPRLGSGAPASSRVVEALLVGPGAPGDR
jgi:hypothetical protein